MNIDKSKLKLGVWYEDSDKNYISGDINAVDPPIGAHTYHSCFPLTVTEHIYTVYSAEQKQKCKHKKRFLVKDNNLIKKLKGRKCTACGSYQKRKWWQPWGKEWEKGSNIAPLVDHNVTIGGGNEDVILGMVNSGDYTLSEALVIYALSCERCQNVLAYKYTNGEDGYSEFSEEWRKTNTECDFCRGMTAKYII